MRQVLIFTGAGLSAESGLDTFRTENGTWTKELASDKTPSFVWDKFNPKQLASLDTFDANREIVFEFYNNRRVQLGNVLPNAAHYGLANLQRTWGSDRVKIFTQNGDDLLSRAGALSVQHVHGKLTEMQCRSCKHTWWVGHTAVPLGTLCPACKSENIKPNVVFFQEEAPLYSLMDQTFSKSKNDLIIVIGTTGLVVPFKRIVGNRHHPQRSYTVLNNLHREDDYPYRRYFDLCMFLPATQAIDSIVARATRFLEQT